MAGLGDGVPVARGHRAPACGASQRHGLSNHLAIDTGVGGHSPDRHRLADRLGPRPDTARPLDALRDGSCPRLDFTQSIPICRSDLFLVHDAAHRHRRRRRSRRRGLPAATVGAADGRTASDVCHTDHEPWQYPFARPLQRAGQQRYPARAAARAFAGQLGRGGCLSSTPGDDGPPIPQRPVDCRPGLSGGVLSGRPPEPVRRPVRLFLGVVIRRHHAVVERQHHHHQS